MGKWPVIVDHLVKSAADNLTIKRLYSEGEKDEAVLQSIHTWYQEDDKRANLLSVLREYNLHELAGKY